MTSYLNRAQQHTDQQKLIEDGGTLLFTAVSRRQFTPRALSLNSVASHCLLIVHSQVNRTPHQSINKDVNLRRAMTKG